MAHVYNSQLVSDPSIFRVLSTKLNSIQDAFSIYHKIQESPEATAAPTLGGPALPALGHALAGSTGAAISNICTYPLDLIITRLQIQRQLRKDSRSPHEGEYKDISDAAGKIYTQEGGLSGFYTGVVEDTAKTIADSFFFFLAYNFLRQSRLQSRRSSSRSLPMVDELSVGIVAGAFAKLLTTPVANIVTRKQTSALVSSRSRSAPSKPTIRDIASQIHSEKGLQGFWSGYSASLILTLNPSITFFLYETFKRSLLPRTQRDNPSTTATFFLAAISKAIASTITYPFSLAKARAQTSAKSVDDNDDEVKEGLEKVTAGEANGSKRTRKAARWTVFSTILHIARTEGLGALYEGLEGEVMKGFFSHGITMIVKEAVHKLIIRLYYMVLKMLRRYPSPQELAQQAKDRAGAMAGSVSDQASEAARTVSNGTQTFVEKGQEMAQIGSARAQRLFEGSKAQVSSLAEGTKTKANEAAAYASNAATTAYDTTKDTATGVIDTSKNAASDVYSGTKSTVANAYDATKSTASSGYDVTKDTASGVLNTGKDTASSAYDATKSTTSNAFDATKSTTSSAYNTSKDTANTATNKTLSAASNAYDATKSAAGSTYESAKSTAGGAYDSTKSAAGAAYDNTSSNASTAYNATKDTANATLDRSADGKDGLLEYVGKKTEDLGRNIRPSKNDGKSS